MIDVPELMDARSLVSMVPDEAVESINDWSDEDEGDILPLDCNSESLTSLSLDHLPRNLIVVEARERNRVFRVQIPVTRSYLRRPYEVEINEQLTDQP